MLAIGWHFFSLGHGDGRLPSFTFLTLLYFALFSIVSSRERRAFWTSRPGGLLLAALTGDACVGAVIGLHGLAELAPLPLGQMACIVGYALVCSLAVNDYVKSVLIARYRSTPADGCRRGMNRVCSRGRSGAR